MSEVLLPPLITTGMPVTKFRLPRPRRDAVERGSLLAQLLRLTREHPVTLICAPAGSGKTTLMVQRADAADPGENCIWVALDESDNDPARLLATLVHSLQSLGLHWERDPAALVANVTGSGSEARAVLAGVVNALCTLTSGRVLWMLDDLQHITDPAAAGLLEALIERLPDHVALVLGSRAEPALPLARLRAHGELGELDARQLRFDENAVQVLARQRWGQEPAPDMVRAALQRTRGWAVGISLMLAAGAAPGSTRTAPQRGAAPRALFDFLAQEVLDELPEELRRFAVDCAVLPELSPRRCEAVTLRSDSPLLLESLLRRHLFLSVVEDSEPVLRFHDLFREFLLAQLGREPAAHRTRLYERAAAAEDQPERAIAHWLDAGRWGEAIQLIVRHGLQLAAAGAYASLEKWIERLPAEQLEAQPRLALLRAECAWSRWDWPRVLEFAAPAAAGLRAAGEQAGRLRAELLLAASLGAIGRLEERAALTESNLQQPLPAEDAAQFHLQRAWSDFSLGHCEHIGRHLATMNELVAQDPARIAPQVAQTFNCHFGGLPGVTEAYLRFAGLCDTVPHTASMPWHSTPVVLGAWAALWQARREGAMRALQRAGEIQHSFGKVRYVLLDATHLQALLLAATGQHGAAQQVLEALLSDLDSSDAEGLRRAWQRPYRSVLARTLWMAQDAEALARQAAVMAGPPRPGEWPLVAGAVQTVAGQAALLAGDLATARNALEAAAAAHARCPAPAFYADPRVALAHCLRLQGDPGAAWRTLLPVLRETARDATPGRMLLEPPAVLRELLALCPARAPETAQLDTLRAVLAPWGSADPEAGGEAVRPAPDELLSPIAKRLTEREREVMELVAQGLSNKLLARQLDLSAHTVKRHLANILDKLDCDNRGQAANLWRRGATAQAH